MESDGLGDLLDFGDAVETPLVHGVEVNDILFAGMEIKTEPDEVQDMMRTLTTQHVDDNDGSLRWVRNSTSVSVDLFYSTGKLSDDSCSSKATNNVA
jgi:hypothetical protein